MLRVGILTVSDRSSRGERTDLGGPAVAAALAEGWPVDAWDAVHVVEQAVAPDDRGQIAAVLRSWCDEARLNLVLTTGGTGFAPRDVTPEATLEIIDRQAPGLAEVMRRESLRITLHGMLSRGVAGMRGQTLIVNLPGSPKGAVENLRSILPVLPHALELLAQAPEAERRHG